MFNSEAGCRTKGLNSTYTCSISRKVKGAGTEIGLRASEGTPVVTGSEARIEWRSAILSSEAKTAESVTEGK